MTAKGDGGKDYHRGRLIRLRSDLSARVETHAAKTGTTVPAVVTEALRDFLDREDGDTENEESP